MRRVCIIGDSHVAALRRAIGLVQAPRSQFDLVFFPSHIDLMRTLFARGTALRSDHEKLRSNFNYISRGRDRIEIADYDEFIVCGLGFGVVPVAALTHHWRSDRMSGQLGDRYPLSDDCFMAAAEGQLAQRAEALRIAGLIRAVSAAPVTVLSQPNLALGVPEAELPPHLQRLHAAERNGDADALADLFRGMCARMSSARKLRIVPPLPVAAASALLNKREFSLLPDDLTPLTAQERLGCAVHANARYGAHALSEALGVRLRAA